ncbi:uncharacterized protein J3R85_017992 [Psidium guajava]|nr:uncharacterized protein J3R85_017992 [Psidium guajava]
MICRARGAAVPRGHRAVVLLRAEAGEGGARREADPDHGLRVLEGHGVARTRLFVGQQRDRGEEDHGVLQGESSHGRKTKWKMNEYRAIQQEANPSNIAIPRVRGLCSVLSKMPSVLELLFPKKKGTSRQNARAIFVFRFQGRSAFVLASLSANYQTKRKWERIRYCFQSFEGIFFFGVVFT